MNEVIYKLQLQKTLQDIDVLKAKIKKYDTEPYVTHRLHINKNEGCTEYGTVESVERQSCGKGQQEHIN